ncbi:hydroxymethylglutaryl-CoA lyase [Terracidiphilus gabretensis]|uniref:hydroxymethylglutaryl-CoA lyase n=1 Tax=Terracidiphilus gabretensis TaxID=1577687 RepID=UPI00071B9A14|nr:hydroxymethylglutaryl-CoA lyase [Terracidiphilus gabretensis]
MSHAIQLVECPRDAWQGLAGVIPAAAKAEYLGALIAAGFTRIDAASFVSPRAVPQMADSEEVLSLLDLPPGVEIIGIVVNTKGAERAIATGKVTTLGFPHSISAEFLHRNQNQTPDGSLATLQAIQAAANQAGLSLVVYISMAFGNPYNDPWSIDAVLDACRELTARGARQISLADTVGVAAPKKIAGLFAAVRAEMDSSVEIGLHLHARPHEATAKIRAAYQAGCRRFDTALAGLGGCPFAQDDLVGNIATETALAELAQLGAELPELKPLGELIALSRDFGNRYSHVAEDSL